MLVLVCERECELGLVWRLIQVYPNCPLKSLMLCTQSLCLLDLLGLVALSSFNPFLYLSVIPFSFIYHFLIDKKMTLANLQVGSLFIHDTLSFLPLRKEKKDLFFGNGHTFSIKLGINNS